nr:hemagglutinin repeat-containing protein [Gilliamella apicola]
MSSSLVKVTVSATANNAKQKNEYHHHSQSGTVIHAGQNVNITAQENIEGKGVDIQGHNINLNAGNDIKFDAAQSTEKIKNRDSGNHYGVGVGFGLIGGQNGFSVEIAASQSKGKENGYSEINHNSKVTAGNALNIHSGRDVILDGAELAGNRVTANIGRDLLISSVQDKEKLDSKHTSSGANVSICVPPICYGGSQASGNFSQDRMKNDYASVNEQSGIFAGTGGYDITVGNHTQLNGAVIASTADKDNNRLDTGTIGFTDIENKAEFEVDSIGMAGSTSHTDGNPKPNGGMPSIYEHDDKTSNITHSAISEGELIIRDTDKQIQDINELSHDTEQAHHKLNPIFDKEKEQTRQEIVTGLKDLGAEIKDLKQAMDKQNNHGNENKMGSDFNKGVDSAIAIITGMMTGDIAGGLAGASAPWLAEQIKIQAGDNEAARLIAHAILGAAVAELQGNSGLAGGAGALTGEIAADIIRKQLYGDKSVNQLTEEEKQNISALAQLAAGLATASAGGSISEVSVAVSSSKNAVENNGLARGAIKGLEKGYEACMKMPACRNGLMQLGVNFGLTNQQILEAMEVGQTRDINQIKELTPEQIAWLDAQIVAKKGLATIMFGNQTFGDRIYNESSNNNDNNNNAVPGSGSVAAGGAPGLPPDDDDNNRHKQDNQKYQNQKQQERFDELRNIYDKNNPTTDLKIDGQTIRQGANGNRYSTRIYESQNLTDKQIYNYAEELAGQPLTKVRDGIYTARLKDGTNITLRNVSHSDTGARWTIDIRNNPTLTNLYRGLRTGAEIKFR